METASKAKTCPTCKTCHPLDPFYWTKNSRRADGFEWQCKWCKQKRDKGISQARRDKRRYAKDKAKLIAREVAREHYKYMNLKCAVVNCSKPADQLHHVDYDKPLDIVPLCQRHHTGVHNH